MFPVRTFLAVPALLALATISSLHSQDEPKKDVEAIALPFEEGKKIVYVWRRDDQDAGTTQLVWLRAKDQPGHTVVRAQWRYAYQGRRHGATGETTLDPQLRPLSYKGSLGALGAPNPRSSYQLEATFETPRVRVHSVGPGKEPRDQEFPLPANAYVFRDQSVEHWVVLAAVLQHRRPESVQLIMPSTGNVLDFKVAEKRTEQRSDGVSVTEWSLRSTAMKAQLWITSNGLLERLQQGELEVVLTDRPALPLAPKAGEDGEKKPRSRPRSRPVQHHDAAGR